MPSTSQQDPRPYGQLKLRLSSLQSHILACVVSEPGEWTTRDIWEDLAAKPERVEKSVYALRKLGFLESHEGYSIHPKYDGSIHLRGDERVVYQVVLAHSPAKLEKMQEYCPLVANKVQKILADLARKGAITGYYSLWPTPSGRKFIYDRISKRR